LEALHDGVIICKAMNAVKPGAIKKINESKMPFKQMENIANFLKACRTELNMAEFDLFTSADLYDGKSVVNVTNGLIAFSRAAAKAGYKGTSLGPKEATARKSKKVYKFNPNSTISKINQGSVETMEKREAYDSRTPTFGADMAKRFWGSKEMNEKK